MTKKIKQYLAEIESANHIKILWACETGSRAWGFPSTDSDFDVRLIYVHQKDWYLTLTEQKDSIDMMLDNNDIDISGWELKKSLNLLRKSNASLLERIQSPIVYQSDESFIRDLRSIAQSAYSKIATIHHYLSMAKKFINELESSDNYKLKKFFYTLRSALVCKWIVEKETIPPIEFFKIYKHLDLDISLINKIEALIELKARVGEAYLHKGEQALIDLVKKCIKQAEEHKNTLPAATINLEEFNHLFRQYVSKYDH